MARRAADDGQDAPAGSYQSAIDLARPRMEHERSVDRLGGIETGNLASGFRLRRVVTRRQHDAGQPVAALDQTAVAEPAGGRSISVTASGPSTSGSTTCASGSPSRTLNSITFGPSAVSIRPM